MIYLQAAAALSVNVGSFEDPFEIPGLMHFLEHMVFMGSEKYPKENAFDYYIKVRRFLYHYFMCNDIIYVFKNCHFYTYVWGEFVRCVQFFYCHMCYLISWIYEFSYYHLNILLLAT